MYHIYNKHMYQNIINMFIIYTPSDGLPQFICIYDTNPHPSPLYHSRGVSDVIVEELVTSLVTS